MIWKSIGNDRRGPTDLLILLRLVVARVICEMFKTKRHTGINMYRFLADIHNISYSCSR